MAEPLFKIHANEFPAWESGLFPSVHPENAPMWIDGRNVVFDNNKVSKLAGWQNIYTPPWLRDDVNEPRPTYAEIVALAQNRNGPFRRIDFGTIDTLWSFDGNASYRRLGVGYSGQEHANNFERPTRWSFENFGRFLLATNGRNIPQIWRGTNATVAEDMNVPFPTAEIFIARGPFVLAMNLGEYTLGGPRGGSTSIAWCDIDDVDDWLPDPANAAGDLVLRDLESEIICAQHLGQQIAVYGYDGVHLVTFRGDPFWFGEDRALDGIGAVGKSSVCAVGQRNYGLGRQGFWVTDGVSFQYSDKPAIYDFVQNQINWDQAAKTVCFHDEANRQVVWYIPLRPSLTNNFGIAFNYQTSSWSFHDRGFSAAEPREIFDFPIVADSDGFIYWKNRGFNDDNLALPAYVQTKPLSMEATDFYKYLDYVKLRLQDVRGDVILKIGVQEYLNDEIEWLPLDDEAVLTSTEEIYLQRSAVYWTFRIEANGFGSDFKWSGLEAFGTPDGARRS